MCDRCHLAIGHGNLGEERTRTRRGRDEVAALVRARRALLAPSRAHIHTHTHAASHTKPEPSSRVSGGGRAPTVWLRCVCVRSRTRGGRARTPNTRRTSERAPPAYHSVVRPRVARVYIILLTQYILYMQLYVLHSTYVRCRLTTTITRHLPNIEGTSVINL